MFFIIVGTLGFPGTLICFSGHFQGNGKMVLTYKLFTSLILFLVNSSS